MVMIINTKKSSKDLTKILITRVANSYFYGAVYCGHDNNLSHSKYRLKNSPSQPILIAEYTCNVQPPFPFTVDYQISLIPIQSQIFCDTFNSLHSFILASVHHNTLVH